MLLSSIKEIIDGRMITEDSGDGDKTIFGYSWESIQARQQKTYKPELIKPKAGDYGSDPLGSGKFKMVPSGDIVDFAERNRRLSKDGGPGSGIKGHTTPSFSGAFLKASRAISKEKKVGVPKNLTTTFTKIGAKKYYLVEGEGGFRFETTAENSSDAKQKAIQSLVVRHAEDSLPTTTFQGIKCTIETDKGQIREGIGYNNQPFKVKMVWSYGFINDTLGTDGDEIDCFIGPDQKAEEVFIIWEKATKEEKVMLGFSSQLDATHAFCIHYQPNPLDFLGTTTRISMEDFKKILGASKLESRFAQGG